MADHTKIEWTDASWPVMTGCTHVSEGCDNCYAARLTGGRLKHRPEYAGLAVNGRFTGEVRVHEHRLDWPLRWRKPRKIFVADMGDLFHEGVPDGFIARVFGVMAACPRHTFQVLTKRHARMRSLLSREDFRERVLLSNNLDQGDVLGDGWPLPSVWLGVSTEDQKWADIRIPALMDTPAAVRFISAEPLLGPVVLNRNHQRCPSHDFPGGFCVGGCPDLISPDWVIVGGESGPGARRMDLDWARELRDQCDEVEIPLFMKQLGSRLASEYDCEDRKGGDPAEWPETFPREFPEVRS